MRTRFSRRAFSAGLVAALTLATALAARGTRRPFSPDAPDFRRRGPADAKVLIVEFSDFQCPACRYAEPTVRQLLQLYDGKVRFVFKHFPLRMHEWARPAAVAAECAGRQGKFWPFHDLMYDHQDDWTNDKHDEFWTKYAQQSGVDLKAWNACRADPAAAEAVAKDVSDADDAWISSTPTFFVNGRRFVGGRQLAELAPIEIDRELKR